MTTPQCGYTPGERLQSGWSSSLVRINKAQVHEAQPRNLHPHPGVGFHKLVRKESESLHDAFQVLGLQQGLAPLAAFSECEGNMSVRLQQGLALGCVFSMQGWCEPPQSWQSPGRASFKSHCTYSLTDGVWGPSQGRVKRSGRVWGSNNLFIRKVRGLVFLSSS